MSMSYELCQIVWVMEKCTGIIVENVKMKLNYIMYYVEHIYYIDWTMWLVLNNLDWIVICGFG